MRISIQIILACLLSMQCGCDRSAAPVAEDKPKVSQKAEVEKEAIYEARFGPWTDEVVKRSLKFRVQSIDSSKKALASFATPLGLKGFESCGWSDTSFWDNLIGTSLTVPMWGDTDQVFVGYYHPNYDSVLVTRWVKAGDWMIDSIACTTGAKLVGAQSSDPLWGQEKAWLLPVRFNNAAHKATRALDQQGSQKKQIESLPQAEFAYALGLAQYLEITAGNALRELPGGEEGLTALVLAYRHPQFKGLDKLLSASSLIKVEMLSKMPPVFRVGAGAWFLFYNKKFNAWQVVLADVYFPDQLAYFETVDFKTFNFIGIYLFSKEYPAKKG